MLHKDYCSFYREVVEPLKVNNPAQKRLDGRSSGGSRDSAGEFIFDNRTWTVHTDSHFEPLQIAFESFENGINPFVVRETARGLALTLTKELWEGQSTRFKHMYIYSW